MKATLPCPLALCLVALITGIPAGCLHLQLDRGPDADKSSPVTCDWEYGFPVVTADGRVSLRQAQKAAADVTNQTVAKVPRHGRMTVEICGDLHAEILRLAKIAIKGSRLQKTCGSTHGPVPEFAWP